MHRATNSAPTLYSVIPVKLCQPLLFYGNRLQTWLQTCEHCNFVYKEIRKLRVRYSFRKNQLITSGGLHQSWKSLLATLENCYAQHRKVRQQRVSCWSPAINMWRQGLLLKEANAEPLQTLAHEYSFTRWWMCKLVYCASDAGCHKTTPRWMQLTGLKINIHDLLIF